MITLRIPNAALALTLVLTCLPGCDEKAEGGEGAPGGAAPAGLRAWAAEGARPLATSAPVDDDADLRAAFGAFVGDAQIVALGESAHGTHEFNQLRLRLFKYLAERHGFRAIVPETGFVEARLVERYVQGDPSVTLDDALARGFTHNMGPWEETRELVEWMRGYNERQADPDARVHFAGKDLPVTGDSPDAALEPLREYLERVDPTYAGAEPFATALALGRKASELTRKVEAAYLEAGAPGIEPDYLDAFTTISFEQLDGAEQRALEAAVAEVAEHFASAAAREAYAAAGPADDYEWHAQLAVVATQLVRDLRSRQEYPKVAFFDEAVALLEKAMPGVPVDRSHSLDMASPDDNRSFFRGRNARELALAENVTWAQRRYGKVMNFAHYGHLVRAESSTLFVGDLEIKDSGTKSEGVNLAEAYGPRYLVVGTTNLAFVDRAGEATAEFEGAPVTPLAGEPDALEHDLAAAAKGRKAFFLDLGAAPGAARRELDRERPLRYQAGFQPINVARSLDGLVVLASIQPGFKLGESRR